MDSSTFSLDQIRLILKPHINQLSFRPLSTYVGSSEFTRSIPVSGETLFMLYSGYASVLLGFTERTLVHGMELSWREIFGGQRINRVNAQQLLFEKNNAGDMGGRWLFQETAFDRRRELSNTFYSSKTTLVVIGNNEEEWMLRIPGSRTVILKAIRKWIAEGVESRRKIITELSLLGKQFPSR
jgi:hypothetical protein